MPVCTNKGCGKEYDEKANNDTACEFHAGAPVFHEGLKSWSCCTKKVVDFDEFLKIPGCTIGRHTDVASEAPKPSQTTADVPAPKVDNNGVEVYGNAAAPVAAVSASKEDTLFVAKAEEAKEVVKEEDLHDAADATITVGEKCKRNGCGKTYEGEASRTEDCHFHPGQAVFHEGSKGWSCCSRKVLEFDEFLKIKGCKTGKHRFTEPNATGPTEVQCRHDWYQTQTTVIISIFAKKINKEETRVVFTNDELKVDIKFLDGKFAKFHTPLSQPIDPAASKYEMLSTKIEVVLRKANGISWATIEPKDNVRSWTTFGTQGGVGTIGGKQAVVAADAPLHLLKK
ncbi:HSP20-like chaperone [Phlyctochytrium arcticum]|nr:HSP20-like chaperone [Phlyctochytrium arcticum]